MKKLIYYFIVMAFLPLNSYAMETNNTNSPTHFSKNYMNESTTTTNHYVAIIENNKININLTEEDESDGIILTEEDESDGIILTEEDESDGIILTEEPDETNESDGIILTEEPDETNESDGIILTEEDESDGIIWTEELSKINKYDSSMKEPELDKTNENKKFVSEKAKADKNRFEQENKIYFGASYNLPLSNDAKIFDVAIETASYANTDRAITFRNNSISDVILKKDDKYESNSFSGSLLLGYKAHKNFNLEFETSYLELESKNSEKVELQRKLDFFKPNANLSDDLKVFRTEDTRNPNRVAFKLKDSGITTLTTMLNIVVKTQNLTNHPNLSFYGSIGAGAAFVDFLGDSKKTLSYQLGFGTMLKVFGNAQIGIGYKFVNIPSVDFNDIQPLFDIPHISDATTNVSHTIAKSELAIITNSLASHIIELKFLSNF